MRNYRNLLVWEKAHRLTLAIYRNTKSFPSDERFDYADASRFGFHSREPRRTQDVDRMARWDGSFKLQWARELSCHIIFSSLETWGYWKQKRTLRLTET